MRIAGVTCSVDYADYLEKVIVPWKNGLDQLIVVTSPDDFQTHRICHSHGATIRICTRFFSDGAYFNKAAGLNEAISRINADWIVCFDADILPPINWRDQITDPEKGILYGAERGENDPIPCGALMLFHADDKNAYPFVEYNNASGYDTEFAMRWGVDKMRWLPFDVRHLGAPMTDWCGRGKDMTKLLKDRASMRGFEHERMRI